jgi:hypothetical protein
MPQYNTSQLNTFLTLFDALTSTRTYTDKVSHLRSHALWFARYVPTCRSNQTPQTFRYKTQSCDLTINYDILNTDIKMCPFQAVPNTIPLTNTEAFILWEKSSTSFTYHCLL